MFMACATPLGNARFPEPSGSAPPQKEFALAYNQLWQRIERVLDDNRILTTSSDKQSGRIVTDYVQGQGQMTALGFLGVIATRYKYNIRLEKLDQKSTRVNITCVLESSGNEMAAWRDVSRDNSRLVANLERWLYEQIHDSL